MYTCGVRNGTAYCWGTNDLSQLGNGNTTEQSSPVALTAAGGIASVSASAGGHTCAIGTDAALYCWGDDTSGQLGNGLGGSSSVPEQIGDQLDWAVVSTGARHTCAVKGPGSREGILYCWGSNQYGQTSTGTPGQSVTSPGSVGFNNSWITVSAGGDNSCAIDGADGSLSCWGRGHYGQLGTGSYQSTTILADVGTGPWVDVSVGTTATCAVKADQTMWCWGRGAVLPTGLSTEPLEVALPSP
jgi:alpha-tubulin suppressor-like RCC1 family protein